MKLRLSIAGAGLASAAAYAMEDPTARFVLGLVAAGLAIASLVHAWRVWRAP